MDLLQKIDIFVGYNVEDLVKEKEDTKHEVDETPEEEEQEHNVDEGGNVTKNSRKYRDQMLGHVDKVGGKQGSFNNKMFPKMGNAGTVINVIDRMMDISKPSNYEKLSKELAMAKSQDELTTVLTNWVKLSK